MLSERSLSQKVPSCLFLSEQSRRGKSLGRKRMGAYQGLRREGLRLSIRLPDGYGVSFWADDNVPKLDGGGGRVMSGMHSVPPEWLTSGYVTLSVNKHLLSLRPLAPIHTVPARPEPEPSVRVCWARILEAPD